MADENEREVVEAVNLDGSASKRSTESKSSLENFVTDHYQQQKDAGRLENDEISDERTSQFFSRAIAESRRMDAEVNKSNKKLDVLHAEFGIDMVNAWHEEHASEVLNTHEQQLVKQAKYQGAVGDT